MTLRNAAACLAWFYSLTTTAAAQDMGHSGCPCLEELLPVRDPSVLDNLHASLGEDYNVSQYGLTCRTHDWGTPYCTREEDKTGAVWQCSDEEFCDYSWCERQWCYIDPNDCDYLYRRSEFFRNRFYSYATCGDMDYYTKDNRVASLAGRTFQVGMMNNSGGWLGAYYTPWNNDNLTSLQQADPDNYNPKLDWNSWSGPVVDFMTQASAGGQFSWEITEPLQVLRNSSNAFFGSKSSFDFCVYATSLGYLDLCVAQFSVTNLRASSTDFFLLDSSPLLLIVVNEDYVDSDQSPWEEFLTSVNVIFQPFSWTLWCFITFFILPVFALLFVLHEYGRQGSTFPNEEKVVLLHQDGTQELKAIPVERYRSLANSLYHVTLSVLQQAWVQPVVTLGAKMTVLGFSFFILTMIAAYTANLAALLTKLAQQTRVETIQDALQAQYRFCAERKNMESITAVFSEIKPSLFVVDPEDLGGDGQPGFNCPKCNSRTRVLQQIHPKLASSGGPEAAQFCHAAIAPQEDLDALLRDGRFCNLTVTGTPIQYTLTGFPVFEEESAGLLSYFLRLKNDGVMERATEPYKPTSTCPGTKGSGGISGDLDDSETALTISDLSGVWLVSFTFALAGLIVTCVNRYRTTLPNQSVVVKRLYKRDQNGELVECLDMEDNDEILKTSWHRENKSDLLQERTVGLQFRNTMKSSDFFPEGRASVSAFSAQRRRLSSALVDDDLTFRFNNQAARKRSLLAQQNTNNNNNNNAAATNGNMEGLHVSKEQSPLNHDEVSSLPDHSTTPVDEDFVVGGSAGP